MEKDVDFRLNYFYTKITKYRKKLYVYINNGYKGTNGQIDEKNLDYYSYRNTIESRKTG